MYQQLARVLVEGEAIRMRQDVTTRIGLQTDGRCGILELVC